MHKQEKLKAFAKMFVTNTYVQKKFTKTNSPLKQSTWQLTLEQIQPLAGIINHVLIQRKKKVTRSGDFFCFEH